MFGREINGKGGIETTISWFEGVDGPNFKVCEVKYIHTLNYSTIIITLFPP